MRRILSTFLLFLCFVTITRAASIPPKGWYDTVLGGTADSGSSSQSKNSHNAALAGPAQGGSSYQSGTSWLDTVLAGPSSQPSEARVLGTVEQAHTTHRTEVPVNSADLAGSSSNQSKAKAPATEAYTYADTPAEDSVTPADAGAEASRTEGETYDLIFDVRFPNYHISKYVELHIGPHLISVVPTPSGRRDNYKNPHERLEKIQEFNVLGRGKKLIGSIAFHKGNSAEVIETTKNNIRNKAFDQGWEGVQYCNEFLEDLAKNAVKEGVTMSTDAMPNWREAKKNYVQEFQKYKDERATRDTQLAEERRQGCTWNLTSLGCACTEIFMLRL
ncbi:hypothetical protein F5880DRAFT_413265 [Lentinula raphanica]|nr:hypothetical protein F5880DRAFT_413265 [Lentinula raphanica]